MNQPVSRICENVLFVALLAAVLGWAAVSVAADQATASTPLLRSRQRRARAIRDPLEGHSEACADHHHDHQINRPRSAALGTQRSAGSMAAPGDMVWTRSAGSPGHQLISRTSIAPNPPVIDKLAQRRAHARGPAAALRDRMTGSAQSTESVKPSSPVTATARCM